MTSLEYHLEGSLDGTLGEISYIFSFMFYGSIEATTEAIYRWFYFSKYRQCIITAPVILTACLRARYTEYAFTRLVHQPLTYAFGAPTTHLRVWRTYEALTNQGETHQYIDHVVCFNTRDSHHHPNEHTILYVFRAPGYDSIVSLN